jgi:hypothetical protein
MLLSVIRVYSAHKKRNSLASTGGQGNQKFSVSQEEHVTPLKNHASPISRRKRIVHQMQQTAQQKPTSDFYHLQETSGFNFNPFLCYHSRISVRKKSQGQSMLKTADHNS